MNNNNSYRTAEQKSFLLSNIPSKTDRDHLAEKISDLGGFHIDSKHFDESASHIICGKLSRTEKFLGACVTGKWILPPRYIEDSHQVQMWLDEEDYEFSVTDTSQPELLVSAAKRWKWKNNMYRSLPFTDWNVSLYMNSKKRAGFQKILHSGGARIVPLDDRQGVQNVAFVLVDAEKFNAVPKLQEDLDILCIREDYLGDFIIKDPEPDIFDYLIDKEGNKQNIVSIIQSPFAEPQNASKSKTEDSGTTDEKLISNDETAVRGKTFESIGVTPTQKVKKGKRPLAVRSSETVFPQQLAENRSSGSDEINLPIKKARTMHNYSHRMPQFSPKNLRSLKKMECSSSNKSPCLKIYEDDCSEDIDCQMSSDKGKSTLTSNQNPTLVKVNGRPTGQSALLSKAVPPIKSYSTPPQSRNNSSSKTAAMEKVPGDVSIEQTSSGCSVVGSHTTILNPPTSNLFSVLAEDSQTPPRPTDNTPPSSSNTLDKTSLHIASKVPEKRCLENSSKSSVKKCVAKLLTKEEEGYESKVHPDEITKSFKKKPVQMSLQRFGFQNSKTPNNGLKTMGSSPRLKSETSSPSKITPTVVSQPASVEKVNPRTDLSNTPDTAIVIDDGCEFDDFTELCNSIKCDQPGPESAGDKRLASSKAISAGGESLDDLMEDLISLCNDVNDDKSTLTTSQQNKTVVSRSLTYHEVCCNDSVFPTVHNNSLLETESVVSTANNLAVKGVEIEATENAENDSTLRENIEGSVIQREDKFQQSCKISDNSCIPALKALELDEKEGIETDSSRAESKILHKCDKPRRLFQCIPSSLNAVSYFLDSASDTLFSMHDPCINSDSKTFTSHLIPQWMRVSSEMKFYVVSLEHGRPDVNQIPTKDLLSELTNLLTCEDTSIRNMAFHYLMLWFEENPPTNPLSSRVYCDLFGFTTNKTLMSDLLDIIISSPGSEGHLLYLNFIVAVCQVNFWHHVNSGDRNSIKECLLIKWLWNNSSQKIHFSTNITHVLEAFKSILTLTSENGQSVVNSMATLLGLIFECLRLVGNFWNIKNFSCLTDCMISFTVNLAKKIMEAFEDGDEQSVILMLQRLKDPWLQTLVTASILSNLNDFLVLETIQANSISLKSIVTQYFFLLPRLTKSPDSNLRQNSRIVMEKLPISQDEANRGAGKIKSCRSTKVNKRNGKGESKVHEAAIRNNAEQLKDLLSMPGVDVNMRDNCGWTPLHEACTHGSYECAELLLNFVPNVNSVFDNKDDMQRRVDISAKGFFSRTPLHDAVVNNHIDICKLLLKYGGKKLLEAKTDDGYTPLDLARTRETRDVLLTHENEGSHSVSSKINIDNHLPLSCMYDQVLRSRQDYLCATRKDCSWFLSLLGLLISSYMNYALLKGGNSLNDKDLAIANSMDHHFSLLQEHLRKITSSETYKTLQFQLHVLKTIASEC